MPSSDFAITAENLGKSYVIGHNVETQRDTTFRDVVTHGTQRAWRKTKDLFQGKPVIQGNTFEEVWALRDIAFEIAKGESVGIIGRNGAGKSTLLKILSRITEPTTGRVQMRGRVASLLEVGTGFHGELSGRENIFLNGAILGMTRQEIKSRFDEIVDFSGVERYLDTPVKRYSSGMYVRLAFAVAAHLEPDTLIVDEVLAVGDMQFQKKCLQKMDSVVTEAGRTVLFVSHNMGAIQGLCKRALWIDAGKLKGDGPSAEIIQQYVSSPSERELFTPRKDSGYQDVVIESAILRGEDGKEKTTFKSGEAITVEVFINAFRRIPRPNFWLAVQGMFGVLFGANMLLDGASPDFIEGRFSLSCTFRDTHLLPMTYSIRMGIRGEDAVSNLIPATEISTFSVMSTAEEMMLSENAPNFYDSFYSLMVPYEWRLPDGKIVKAGPVRG